MDKIIKIFNSEDEKEIKDSFKELLIEQFKKDLEDNGDHYYLFNQDYLTDKITEMFDEVVGEVRIKLKNKMMKEINKLDLKEVMSKLI